MIQALTEQTVSARAKQPITHVRLLNTFAATAAALLCGSLVFAGSYQPLSSRPDLTGGILAKTQPKPTFTVPAPPPKAATSTGAAFNAFINAHPIMRPYADTIWKWSKTYGIDQVVFASLLWRESFAAAQAAGKDPSTILSSAGAVGLGQVMPSHVGETMDDGHVISQADLTNPNMNAKISAWLFSKAYAKTGNYNTAYSQGYNPGYTGPDLLTIAPKGYVPKSGLSPQQSAAVSVETSADRHALTDPWVVLSKGKLKYVNSVNPPPNVATYGGSPLTRSGLVQHWNQQGYADTYFAYTGKHASASEIVKILGTAQSVYTLGNNLAKRPGFVASPVYKSHAPGLVENAKEIMGRDWQPPKGFIAKAIAENWDQATVQAEIRKLPAYQNGPVFQQQFAANESHYSAVYGKPDASAKQLITKVTQEGWSTDQFDNWLRSQPAYQQSGEYRANFGQFANLLATQFGYAPSATLSGAQIASEQNAGAGLSMPGVK